jgi:hypothetical protein
METTIISIYFSFCIYGTDLKYYNGLLENLKILSSDSLFSKRYSIHVIIGYTDSTREDYLELFKQFPSICLNKLSDKFHDMPMISRLLNFDKVPMGSYFISRDADSRITERDLWCLHEFLKTDNSIILHIIRDHYYHKKRIMGGMFGIKKLEPLEMEHSIQIWKDKKHIGRLESDFGIDELFLEQVVYPRFKSNTLIHSNSVGYSDEYVKTIDIPQISDDDFIGNSYEHILATNTFLPKFKYKSYITPQHIVWLFEQNQFAILSKIGETFDIHSLLWHKRADILYIFFISSCNMRHLSIARNILLLYKYALVDDKIIKASNALIHLLRKTHTIIASFETERETKPNEFIIQYGEYPHTYECLPHSESMTIYRHPIYFNQVYHDSIESHKCWNKIDRIYILNLIERKDRYMHLLVDLCRVHAPLHKIHHYKAKKEIVTGNKQQDAYIGATKNHLDVINNAIINDFECCLVLEDDITIISDINRFWKSLNTFLDRAYEFDVCFLGYSKIGEIKEHDDLIWKTYQPCTTSSSYLVKKSTIKRIQECFETGYLQMKKGESPDIYCCDRYWAKLHRDQKSFVFVPKLCYQRITHSDITNSVNYNFD